LAIWLADDIARVGSAQNPKMINAIEQKIDISSLDPELEAFEITSLSINVSNFICLSAALLKCDLSNI
jgi:hypothetical protein